MDYSAKVIDHCTNPRNIGSIENCDGIGEVGNAKCGDIMKIFLKIEDRSDCRCKISDFWMWGCNCIKQYGYRAH